MERTVCELFAGVGGFRCGLNGDSVAENEKWRTAWFNQWEPSQKTQYAYGCYINHYGTCLDSNGVDTTNVDIETVRKDSIPNFNLLVGGFPCQDYSVASTLATSQGIQGKKGVLWWSIRDILDIKKPPFVLLENVDRLLKSPARQRGRDFAVILGCLRDAGYAAEWRVINAADYGYQQRRRRTFIFAYRIDTEFGRLKSNIRATEIVSKEGFFATAFPVVQCEMRPHTTEIPKNIGTISSTFSYDFRNAGYMKGGQICTLDVEPKYAGNKVTLGDILETGMVDERYFIPNERLYYTDKSVNHSDETKAKLSDIDRHTWQYIKGGKKMMRTAANGHEYLYSEGPVPMIDEWELPARTMLTSEGSFGRSTHIVRDKQTGAIRLLTPEETERIQGFPTGYTKWCLIDGERVEMPEAKRRFCMGNALVVNLIRQMEPVLCEIFENEK